MEMNSAVAELLKSNNGTLKASAAREAGIDNKELQRLTEAGLLERVTHGLYISPSDMADEYL
ncbi:MAG: type IV toxin-antitoxin system AbiEi family antitoxin domain-containing protein, partial [Candidatus Accumulibacter sp.]|nr:type IV toxin-antitoxin system AbiEi family antitoxin domain-containing protein [Accumulibacter sp.]